MAMDIGAIQSGGRSIGAIQPASSTLYTHSLNASMSTFAGTLIKFTHKHMTSSMSTFAAAVIGSIHGGASAIIKAIINGSNTTR
jgi:hypothetical protein